MKNRLPYIILPIILAVLGSHKALSQADLVDINIQYNNKTDRESENALTVEDISEKKIALDEILNTTEFYASGNITLQIVFYDRTALGPFQLKEKHKNLTAETYVTKWNTKHSNEKRILMLFVKDQHDGNYEFSKFEVSNLPHIFPVVENYIQEQIMAKTNTHAEAVNDGLNALKNAYDDQFKEKLVEMGPKMLDFKYYYKGYTYISHPYYYFEYEETERDPNLNQELEYWHELGLNTTKYFDVYLKNWRNRKATVFNADFGQNLMYKREEQTVSLDDFETVYVKTEGGGRHQFTDYHTHFDMKDLFDLENCSYSSVSEIPENSDLYALKKEMSTSQSIIKMKIVESDLKERYRKVTIDEPVYYKSRYKLFNGDLQGAKRNKLWTGQDVSEVTNRIGWSVGWSGFYKNKPTWCNVFASDLSNYIYGKVEGNYPVPYGTGGYTANQLFSYFTSDGNYVNIREKGFGKKKIWKLINSGYPVYFSGKGKIGHIETGFPTGTNFQKFNKTKYNGEYKNLSLNNKSDFLSIGAGGKVGFKSYQDYDFLKNSNTKALLYLEYLKKEY